MAWAKRKTPVTPVKVTDEPEEWDYFEHGELQHSRGSAVCMTCEHFTYSCTKQCITLLTCPIHQRLIQQGEHLTKRCRHWQNKRILEIVGVLKLLKNRCLSPLNLAPSDLELNQESEHERSKNKCLTQRAGSKYPALLNALLKSKK